MQRKFPSFYLSITNIYILKHFSVPCNWHDDDSYSIDKMQGSNQGQKE